MSHSWENSRQTLIRTGFFSVVPKNVSLVRNSYAVKVEAMLVKEEFLQTVSDRIRPALGVAILSVKGILLQPFQVKVIIT